MDTSAPSDSESIEMETKNYVRSYSNRWQQYKVQVGDVLYVEKLSAEADDVVKFDTVLAFEDENGIQVGTPTLDIPVEAKVLKNGKAKKITVFTYKPKKNEKRKMGHRQPYTKIEITSINGVANA